MDRFGNQEKAGESEYRARRLVRTMMDGESSYGAAGPVVAVGVLAGVVAGGALVAGAALSIGMPAGMVVADGTLDALLGVVSFLQPTNGSVKARTATNSNVNVSFMSRSFRVASFRIIRQAPSHRRHGIWIYFTPSGGEFKRQLAKLPCTPKGTGGVLPMGKERPERFLNLDRYKIKYEILNQPFGALLKYLESQFHGLTVTVEDIHVASRGRVRTHR
jgi:hypothetical protein